MLALSPISFASKFQNSLTFNLGLRCFLLKKSIKEISPGGAISKHFVQSTLYVHTAHMHKLHLMTPQGHLVHLAMVYGQSSHLRGIIKILNKKILISYLNFRTIR